MGDRCGEAISLHNLGFTYSNLANNPQAIKYYQKAIAIYEELSDREGAITTLLNLGSLYALSKRKRSAFLCYWKAKKLVAQIEHEPLSEKVKQFKNTL
jgi:tetratricopeptide (TPR) repeat protein